MVGAGPGVRDFLTLRALDRLERADLVLYDALVDPSLLDLAPDAQRFYVGKRAGRHAMSQRTIEALLIRHAREGKRVVRLKAGDPFVLGRGGEEALALEEAGVEYEVVPGLSSALTAPTFAGIPITHRGLSTSFLVLSGHDEAAYAPLVDAVPAGSTTLVVLMGFRGRAQLVARLVAAGWDVDTPAAIVAGAGTADQQLWTGSLDALANCAPETGGAPVTLVIGATAGLQGKIALPSPSESLSLGESSRAMS